MVRTVVYRPNNAERSARNNGRQQQHGFWPSKTNFVQGGPSSAGPIAYRSGVGSQLNSSYTGGRDEASRANDHCVPECQGSINVTCRCHVLYNAQMYSEWVVEGWRMQ
jgi:hypothetical protein